MSSPYTAIRVYPWGFKAVKLRGGVQLKIFNSLTNQSKMKYCIKILYIYLRRFKHYYYRKLEKLPEMRSEELKKVVEERVKLARSAAPQGSSNLLVRQPQVVSWGTKKVFNKEDIIAKMIGYKPTMGRKQDESCMDKYLKRVMVNGLQDPKLGTRSAYLPEGAPLLEFLAVYQEEMDAWKYPTREEINLFQRSRGLAYTMMEEVQVKVIEVGSSSPSQIAESVEWFWNNWVATQEKCPTQVVSLDNEQVSMTLYDMMRMAGKLDLEKGKRISKRKEPKGSTKVEEEDRFIPLPAKIMLGDGVRFCLIISTVLERDRSGEYVINRLTVQDELLEFISEIPVATGVGVARDVTDIEFFFSLISGKEVEMKGSIELGSLAVLAGYEFNARNMTALGIQVMGTILNKTCSTGDDKWGWKWADIPEALQVYGLGDIRFGYMCYTTLAGILQADTFPDPEICCKYLECSQVEFTAFFMDWTRTSLEGVEVHADAAQSAGSRKGLIDSLRFRLVDGSVLSDHQPNRIRIWKKLIGGWPTITSGGCRFLLQARIKFIHQMELLKRLNYPWRFGLTLPEVSQEFREYARFGISRSALKKVIWTEEVPESARLEMVRPLSLETPMLELDPGKDKCSKILQFCTQNGRIQKLAVLEWCRMYPNRIVNFLQRMDADRDYKLYYRPVYDSIRLIFWRVVNRPTIKIALMEEDQDEKLKRQLMRAEAMVEKTKIEHEAYVKRAEYLAKVISSKDKVERSRWRENLPQLPEWKLRRKRKRELRRQEEEEESLRKRRKVSSVRSRLGSRINPQPTSASDTEVESDELGIEEVYLGAGERAPKCKRILTLKAGKKKGKKKKSGSSNQLESIMREVVDLDHYEYPGRKLTESDEELEARMKGKRSDEDCVLETQFMEDL